MFGFLVTSLHSYVSDFLSTERRELRNHFF